MEEEGILDRSSIIDLFALHYIYQPKIQASLDELKEGWNHHPVSTESLRGVRSYLELNDMNVNEFGIDPDMSFNNSSENVEEHIKHKANLTIKLMKYWNSWKSFSLNW